VLVASVTAGMHSTFVIGLDPGVRVSYFAVRIDMGAGDTMGRASPTCSVLSFGCVAVDFSKDNPVHDALTNPLESIWQSPELSGQCRDGLGREGGEEREEREGSERSCNVPVHAMMRDVWH
jgi:hypothetical protein